MTPVRSECRRGHGAENYVRHRSGAPHCRACAHERRMAARPVVSPYPAPAWMTHLQRRVFLNPNLNGRIVLPRSPRECWGWSGGQTEGGYGRLRINGQHWYAHRLAFYLVTGERPEAVCHGCDNPPCTNPEHLRSGTLSDNTAEMWAKGRANVPPALSPEGAWMVAAAARRWLGRKGSGAAIEGIALRAGVSRRTVYRLATGSGIPKCYQRTLTPTPQEIAA